MECNHSQRKEFHKCVNCGIDLDSSATYCHQCDAWIKLYKHSCAMKKLLTIVRRSTFDGRN